MAKITFKNLDKTVVGAEGESILDIALNNDIPLEHACGGFCSCTTCHVIVLSGADQLTAMDEDESERMSSSLDDRAPSSRLGCQARLKGGDVIIEVKNLERY